VVANSAVQVLTVARQSLARILGNLEEYFGATRKPDNVSELTETGRASKAVTPSVWATQEQPTEKAAVRN
jgi:hypothetical protein